MLWERYMKMLYSSVANKAHISCCFFCFCFCFFCIFCSTISFMSIPQAKHSAADPCGGILTEIRSPGFTTYRMQIPSGDKNIHRGTCVLICSGFTHILWEKKTWLQIMVYFTRLNKTIVQSYLLSISISLSLSSSLLLFDYLFPPITYAQPNSSKCYKSVRIIAWYLARSWRDMHLALPI